MAMPQQSSTTERQPSVLIVDDEPQIVDFLQMGFAYEGFSVEKLHDNPPQLLQTVRGIGYTLRG